MANSLKIKVNGLTHGVSASLDTPLLYVLHNELHLHGPRFGCGLAQCGACSVLLDGKEIRSCVTPVAAVSGKSITTLEGLPALYAAQRGTAAAAPALHPLQQAWIDVQVPHCGYCQNGMMIQAADLLATTKSPSEDADPHRDERPPVPLRHLSENPDRDPEGRGRDGEGRCSTMTGLLHEKEFSRKTFVKGGGALIVGFGLAGAAPAGEAATRPPTSARLPAPTRRRSTRSSRQRRQHRHGQARPARMGPRHRRPASCRWSREELDMDMSQVDSTRRRTRGSNGTAAAAAANGISSARAARVRAAAVAARSRRCSGSRRRSSAFRSRSLTVDKGVVSRRRQDGQVRRPARRQAVQASTMNPTTLQPGAGAGEAGQRSTSSSARRRPRIDIPAKVTGSVHVRPQHPRPGDAPRPRRAARAARAPSPRRTTSR